MNHGRTYTEVVAADQAGAALAEHLARRHAHSSEDTWRARIERREVTVDGEPATHALELRAGHVVTWAKPPWDEPDAPRDAPVIFDDDAIVAVNKPAGLPVLPGAGYLENTLLAIVRATCPTASPAHRLGRGTSGIVLFVKTPEAARAVQDAWQAHRVTKIYRALVDGSPSWDTREIDDAIGLAADPIVGALHVATSTGKRARSTARVIERRTRVGQPSLPAIATSLVDVEIETGRPHQIRIHMAAAGHPLVGDPLYGVGGVRRVDSTARPGDVGYHLHAHTLALAHPTTGASLTLTAPAPPLLRANE